MPKVLLKYKFSILFFCSWIVYSQNEANIWYFGNNAGLDFNSGTPVALTDGQLVTDEGCATISNSSGNLLFYTDGVTIWNRNHAIMQNGSGLNGSFSSTQSAIIVPKPSSSNIYYVFTVDFQGQPNGLQYSEVDMTLDSGLGAVTANKNILLVTPVLEKLTSVKHANGIDFWVIAHKNESSEFYAYLVTSAGVQSPVITDIGFVHGGVTVPETGGYLKVSPDGSRIVSVFPEFMNNIHLFDFDTNTGVLSNHINFTESPGAVNPYGVEFSPSGNLLYVSGVGGIDQYDLTLPTPFQMQLNTVFVSDEISGGNWRALQLGPDGKIYATRDAKDGFPEIHTLSVINNPDELGVACDFQLDAIFLGSGSAASGLPQFIQSFFNAAITATNNCLGAATQFGINSSQPYDSINWDFGDGNTSTMDTPMHTYINAGDYTVTVTITSGTDTATNTQIVTIYDQPIAAQPTNLEACDDNNDGFTSFNLSNLTTSILNGQDPTVFTVNYYASTIDYNNNDTIADPANYINASAYTQQTIIASIINSNNSLCEDSTSFTIQVYESPTPNQNVGVLSDCDNTSVGTDTDGVIEFDLTQNESIILNGQSTTDFTVNYFTDTGLTNQITNPSTYQNINASEIIYVQVVNDDNTNCTAQTSFNIEVFSLPTVNTLVELKQCDDDLDGFSVFNLTEVYAEVSSNHLNETITFHESQTEAENNTNSIANETTYINQTVSTDAVWARVENTNGCYRLSQINLIVSTTQIPTTFTRDFYKCDDGIDATDGIATFDLSTVATDIQNLFPIGQQLIINFYRNQADALSELNPIVDITNYQNIGYPNNQDVYIRVDSALDNDCLGLGHHITLNVETIPIANPVTIAEQCDDDGDGMYAFDTSNIENQLLNGQTNVTIEYLDGLGNALTNPLPNPFLTAPQTITAKVTNTTSQDPDGACFDEIQITFTVDAAAVAYAVPDFIECDNDNDGQFAFDTSNVEATVLNGQTGMIVTYTDEDGNTLPSPLPNPFTSNTQTIIVRVENQLSAICYDETTITFSVSEQPIANPVANDFVCDDISNDGQYTFTLSDYNSQILNGQSQTTFEIFYFEDNNDAQSNVNALPNNYAVNSTSQTIFARIQNINNPACFEVISFELGVHYLPIANEPEDILICDDETNDEIETFDLSVQNSVILNGQSAIDNVITYHLSLADADTNTNTISEDFTNTENPQTIYVRLENNDYPDCYTTTSFQISVNKQPILEMQEQWPICEGDTVEIIADTGYDQYLWSTGETSQSIIVDTAGTYEITVTNSFGNLSCTTTKILTVANSDIATITNIETVDWTQNDNIITVFVEGNGDYEYSLDGFTYQDSNEFTNLTIDEYIIYVRDKNGCGVTTESVYLLYYPRFFTPNNDGYNDTWQIINSNREPNNKIYIFDRYGRLLKQLSSIDSGWDGVINGRKLPTNDYWFVLQRQNGRIYKGHFTLKR